PPTSCRPTSSCISATAPWGTATSTSWPSTSRSPYPGRLEDRAALGQDVVGAAALVGRRVGAAGGAPGAGHVATVEQPLAPVAPAPVALAGRSDGHGVGQDVVGAAALGRRGVGAAAGAAGLGGVAAVEQPLAFAAPAPVGLAARGERCAVGKDVVEAATLVRR